MKTQKIRVDYVARVEGEAAVDIVFENGKIIDAKLDLYEPPRFFEAFLVGRKYEEVPKIVSRICGICPHPHQLSAVQAIERALGVPISLQTKALRRLMHLGCWIQSHALHIYMLAAPDYLGYESVIPMAQNPDLLPVVKRALQLKRLGNDLAMAIGGREVHPITITVGGFTKIPEKGLLKQLRERLTAAKEDALETARLAAKLPVPDFTRKCEHVALHNIDMYPINGGRQIYAVNQGRLVSTEGLDIPNEAYIEHLIEKQVAHSNAKHSIVKGRDSFLVGPLARVNLNFDQLSSDAKAVAREIGFQVPNFNPFMSGVARGIEMVSAIDDSITIIDYVIDVLGLKPEEISYQVKAGEGYAVTEAPRGICCHGYMINRYGVIEKADIVAPTSRNAFNIEKDFWEFAPTVIDLPLEEATLKCEMLLRTYDPCFSCSVHSLKVRVHKN